MKNALESFKLTTFTNIFIGLGVFFPVQSYAACPRKDVDHYLEQGFNQEQIIKLCSEQKPVAAHQPSNQQLYQKLLLTPNEQKNNSNTALTDLRRPSGIYGNPNSVFLANSVRGYNIKVTKKSLFITRKECFDYGQEDWNKDKDNNTCPNIKYTIAREGLKIIDRDMNFLGMGSTALYIAGNIKIEFLDLDKFNPEQQKKISETIQNNTEKLKLTLRPDTSQEKAEGILLRLAKQPKK